MKLGTETASLTNWMMANSKQPEPEVGMGATRCCWTDRYAGTIIKVTATQTHVREDKAIRTDNNGMSEAQEYQYEPDPHGRVTVFRLTKRGWRGADGSGLLIGTRDHYYDYGF